MDTSELETAWLHSDYPSYMTRPFPKIASDRKARLYLCGCYRRAWATLGDRRSRGVIEAAERYADGTSSARELASAAVDADLACEDSRRIRESLQNRQDFHEIVHGSVGRAFVSGDNDVAIPQWLAAFATADATWVAARGVRAVGIAVDDWVLSLFDSGAEYLLTAINQEMVDAQFAVADQLGRRLLGSCDPTWDSAFTKERAAHAALLRCVFGNPFHPIVVDPAWCVPNAVSIAQAIYEDHAFDQLPMLADALQDAGCTDTVVLGHCRGGGEHARGCWVVDLILGKK